MSDSSFESDDNEEYTSNEEESEDTLKEFIEEILKLTDFDQLGALLEDNLDHLFVFLSFFLLFFMIFYLFLR